MPFNPDSAVCQHCGVGTTIRDHPHCPACEVKFLDAGICKWCGVAERKPKKSKQKRSDYCEVLSCQNDRSKHYWYYTRQDDNEVFPKYRDADARENTRETKGGTGNGAGH